MPAIIKPSRISVSHQTEPTRDGALTTVSAYILFDFSEPDRLLTEQALWPMVTEQMPQGTIFDKCQLKPKGELIIAGSALSPTDAPIEGIRVSAQFGNFQKQLTVFGDRYWRLTDEGVQMSRPVPFLEMPICDARAFGGDGFTPNAKGKGFGARRLLEAGFDAALPNVEHSAQLIKSPDDRPVPAHFGPIPPDDATRLRYLGTYDQHWIDHVSPLKPDDFNPLYHCEAPPDQRFDTFFEGGETFTITGMSRGETTVGGRLPRLTARCFYKLAQHDALMETTMRCDTVTLFPNVQKATLTFRGLVRGSDRFAEDIASLMVALEQSDAEAREREYYADVFKKRTSKDDAHKYALSDYQLMPQVNPAIISARRQAKLEKAAADRQKYIDNQNWAMSKLLEDEGLPGDLFPPSTTDVTDDIPLIAQPTQEEMENGDLDLAALLDDVKAVEDALLERREREMVRAELQRRAFVAAISPDQLTPSMKKPIVEEETVEKFPDLELDPDLEEGLRQIKGQLSSTSGRNQIGLTANAEDGNHETDAQPADLIQLFDEPESLSQEEVETAFQQAVARALKLPEGGILSDLRKAIEDMDLSALDGFADDIPPAAEVSADQFDAMLAELSAPSVAATPVGASAGGPPNSGINGQTNDNQDPQGAQPLADIKQVELLETLMEHARGLEPEDSSPPAGQSPGESALSSRSLAMEQLKEAEETVDENMAMARRNSPTPLFPPEPLPEGVPVRIGAFVAEKLREGHDFKGADLAGADLRGADFSGMDLAGTFFEQADLTGARFCQSNLAGAVFAGAKLDNADFSGADLTQANLNKVSARNLCLDRARLHDLQIFQSDLSGSTGTGADLETIRFIESTLDNVRLQQSRITDCQLLTGSAEGFAAIGSKLLRTMFVVLPMSRMNLSDSELERVGFMEVQAAGANCRNGKWKSVGVMGGSDLTGSRFDNLDAVESSFNTAKMAECCFLRAKGNACFFNACDLEANDFRLASFHNSLFGRSNFEGSDFFGANLFMAALTGVNLERCSMRAANLYAANLLEARLKGCDLTGANLGKTLMEQPAHA
ncbi:DUF2169 family type VI secretion system accessory protein [Roseibium sp. SCP14]|uniref:DUF2169 family type VI secretion system accessory protein n=1 Tax=Roseibium sp. SCP14 TaxID=3141375 RepID=UPI00333556FD